MEQIVLDVNVPGKYTEERGNKKKMQDCSSVMCPQIKDFES